jgi:hypothetical protein
VQSRFAPRVAFGRLAVLTTVLISLTASLVHSRAQVTARSTYERAMATVAVVPPDTAPEPSQKSIELALVMFGIQVPASASHPVFDPALRDRGLTSRGAFMDKAVVTVGPAAFSSWSLLGSTLAHELEVHCQQNFLFIYMMDALGLDGTGAAERQAYAHELRNARRFGLAGADASLIADTMDYYYPDTPRVAGFTVPVAIRGWLARNVLSTPRL